MKRLVQRPLSLVLAFAALGVLALATGAQAATLNLKCSGKGPQVKAQEYETASCAVEAGQKRNIEGVLRNDKNKPVAGTLNVTFANWIPQDEDSFSITPEKTITVKAGANGKFKVAGVTTKTEATITIEAVGDVDSEVTAIAQEVNFQRIVTATAKKLGGGRVQVTVKGASGPLKVGITDESGYYVSGGASRKASKAGVATFDLGSQHGTFGIYVDAGVLGDLYYFAVKPLKL